MVPHDPAHMFDDADIERVTTGLREHGAVIEPGLTERELDEVERTHDWRFPPELRALLERMLPSGPRFPNWREPRSAALAERLAWPADGLCFHVEHGWWLRSFGPRPAALVDALAVARAAVAKASPLVPLFGHRYLPARPATAGNPVFSVYGADVIYYGVDLIDWFAREFAIDLGRSSAAEPRQIELWSELEAADEDWGLG